MNEVKKEVLNFFNTKGFEDKSNRKYQRLAYDLAKNLNLVYEVDNDQRNYSHYTGLVIDYDAKGRMMDVISRYDLEDEAELLMNEGPIISIFISFSDINRYARVFANRRFLGDKNEIEVEYLRLDTLSDKISMQIHSVMNKFAESLDINFLDPNQLSKKVTWLNETNHFKNFEFQPTIEDLLFGSFELYSELDI